MRRIAAGRLRTIALGLLTAVMACTRPSDTALGTGSEAVCRFAAEVTMQDSHRVEGAAGYQVLENGMRLQLQAPSGFLAVFGSSTLTEPVTGEYALHVASLIWRPDNEPAYTAQADARNPGVPPGMLRIETVENGLVRGTVEMGLRTRSGGDPVTLVAEFEAQPGSLGDTTSAFYSCLERLTTKPTGENGT